MYPFSAAEIFKAPGTLVDKLCREFVAAINQTPLFNVFLEPLF
jgi:hypothetical protein